MEDKEYENYPEFRELLNIAIGKDRQKSTFAKEADIAPAHLSRMLNLKKIPQPAVSTLEKIANASRGRVSLPRLLISCGYTENRIGVHQPINNGFPTVSDAILEEVQNIILEYKKGVQEFCRKATRYDTLDDILDTIEMLYGLAPFQYTIEKPTVFNRKGHYNAENKTNVVVSWTSDQYRCEFGFILFFCETKQGGYIFSDAAFDLQSLINNEHPTGGKKLTSLAAQENVVISDYQTVYIIDRKNMHE